MSRVDITGEARLVTLVKVPEPLRKLWTNRGANEDVGRVRWHRKRHGKQKLTLMVNPKLLAALPDSERAETPRLYTLNVSVPKGMRLFSTDADGESSVSMDGVVTQIATMTPIVDEAYERRLKRRREIASHDPRKRRTHETEIKDTSERAFVGFDIQQDAEEERARMTKYPDLFSAFDAKEYWTMAELKAVVEKPDSLIRQQLRYMCVYHNSGEHRACWELKPEFKVRRREEGEGEDDEDAANGAAASSSSTGGGGGAGGGAGAM